MGSPTTKQVRPARSGQARDDAGEQLVLAAAGVLELIDEQVANVVGDSQRGVGGQAVFAAQNALGICATSMNSTAPFRQRRFAVRRQPAAAA